LGLDDVSRAAWEEDEMSENEEMDLRTTSDRVLADAKTLTDLEMRKRDLEPGDPERVRLSDEIATVGRSVERAAAAERDLAGRVHAESTSEPGSDDDRPTIDETPPSS
jgi:hypothetical protein